MLILALVALPVFSQAQTLRLILKDHSVVVGDLLGVDDGVLSLETATGKSVDVPLVKVKKAFDADTSQVVSLDSLGGGIKPAATTDAAQDEDSVVPQHPAHHAARAAKASVDEQTAEERRYHSRKVTSEILDWTGLGVGLVGIVVMVAGSSEMNNATSTYYPNETPSRGADYEIDGKWYTADQYNQYYEGQTYAIIGGVVTVAGLATSIVGMCIAPKYNPEGAMLHLEDGQVALAMPKVDLNPRSGELRATLVGASF
jgi:drug/metabolite transporter superfamily protein YnfA